MQAFRAIPVLLIAAMLFPGVVWGQPTGLKPSFQSEKMPPAPSYGRTQPQQYEKPLDLRLTPNRDEMSSVPEVKKNHPPSKTAKAKKKPKQSGLEAASSESTPTKSPGLLSPFGSGRREGERESHSGKR